MATFANPANKPTDLDVCLAAVFGQTEKDSLGAFMHDYPEALDLMVAARKYGSYTPEMVKEHLGNALAAVPAEDRSRELFRLVEFLASTTLMLKLKPLSVMGAFAATALVADTPPVESTPPPPSKNDTQDSDPNWPPANVHEGSKTKSILKALGPVAELRKTLTRNKGSISALRKELEQSGGVLKDNFFRAILFKYYGLKANDMPAFLAGESVTPAKTTVVRRTKKDRPESTNISGLVRQLFKKAALKKALLAQGSVAALAKHINALPKVKAAGLEISDANLSMLIKNTLGKNASVILGTRQPKRRR